MQDQGTNVPVVTFTAEEKRTDNVLKFLQPNPNLKNMQFLIANRYAAEARWIIDNLPRCPQRTHALNDLKTSKDAAICASLDSSL